jgi:signal transduction histidine kinase
MKIPYTYFHYIYFPICKQEIASKEKPKAHTSETMNNHAAATDQCALKPIADLRLHKEIGKIILATQEKERIEVGKELHDNVCQMLATVKLYLDTGLKNDNDLREFVALGKDMLLNSMEELRRISKSLAPPSLGQLPLEQSLTDLVYTIQIARREIYLEIDGLKEEMIPNELKVSIYRIIQEQLNNILKYAEANRIDVSILQQGRRLLIQVMDDGKGFDPREKRKGSSGITNMINRVNVFGGKIKIDAAPGKGCILSVQFCL